MILRVTFDQSDLGPSSLTLTSFCCSFTARVSCIFISKVSLACPTFLTNVLTFFSVAAEASYVNSSQLFQLLPLLSPVSHIPSWSVISFFFTKTGQSLPFP